ncbi:winged helix DNA-binding domain-containing protein [Microbacterium sp. CFH 31415]|uniref:winged helix DNA-binding domain-containing protein n=1 Tax=Microbacterium sp. CFH 31415 TaxID=2921732 RepID=UPI001F135EA0|nr:winged helix DNA-binding domain-containing protein [Microbacterium sp. CFH 31415]MCH6229914.1 winged helix DNA-binding domain-containing protein [Microbacterium sp. CFH 31415]
MDAASVRHERLRSHRLSAPAATVLEAATHMLATQAQEFWGGRWAIAARTRGRTTVHDVDAAFDRGEIVRSWTQRGTIHLIPARDLAWVLSITGERQGRQAAAVRRAESIDDDELGKAERLARAALRGGNRLTRKELFDVLETGGVSTARQRGYHLLVALSLRAAVCQGPVVPRPVGPTREQFLVLTEEWVTDAASPADPLAELFFRYISSHGPAGARDFAWWTGLPLGVSRSAADAASDRLVVVDDQPEPQYVAAGPAPRRSPAAPAVLALPPFEEYYLSYVDRTVPCAPEFLAAIGPSMNGIVRPIIVAQGEVVGVWTHSIAVGRHADAPIPELFTPGMAGRADVGAALDRYREFITG